MSLSRLLCCIAGCAFASVAYTQGVKIVDKEAHLLRYDENLDREVVASYEHGCTEASPGIAIAKEYLRKWKAKLDIERSQYIDYIIINGDAQTKLLTAPADANLKIGKIEKNGEHYLIPVLDEDRGHVDVYSYSVADKKVLKIKSIGNDDSKAKKYIFADNVSVLKRSANTVSIAPAAAGPVGDDSLIDIYKKENSEIVISDATEYGGKLFVVGFSFPEASPYEGALWIAEVDRRKNPIGIVVHEAGLEGYKVLKLSFVNSSHREPSVMVVKFKENFRKPQVNLMGNNLNLIWESEKRSLERDQFTIAGVCDEEYLVVEQLDDENREGVLEATLISGTGQALGSKGYSTVDIGSLREVIVTSGSDAACVIANFSQMEDSRRPDGWYSWLGYRIDSIELVCNPEH